MGTQFENLIFYRQRQRWDYSLLNRQPTLRMPDIPASLIRPRLTFFASHILAFTLILGRVNVKAIALPSASALYSRLFLFRFTNPSIIRGRSEFLVDISTSLGITTTPSRTNHLSPSKLTLRGNGRINTPSPIRTFLSMIAPSISQLGPIPVGIEEVVYRDHSNRIP